MKAKNNQDLIYATWFWKEFYLKMIFWSIIFVYIFVLVDHYLRIWTIIKRKKIHEKKRIRKKKKKKNGHVTHNHMPSQCRSEITIAETNKDGQPNGPSIYCPIHPNLSFLGHYLHEETIKKWAIFLVTSPTVKKKKKVGIKGRCGLLLNF